VLTVESFYAINHNNTLTNFSVAQVNDCVTGSQGCNGGLPNLAFQYIVKNGLETESEYPYNSGNGETGDCKYNKSEAIKVLSNWTIVPPKSFNLTQAAVFKTPVTVVMEADQSVFQLYTSGVITAGCGASLDHLLVLVGWAEVNGTKAWIAQNTWGWDWGVDVYVYIAFDPTANAGLGLCGIYSTPYTPTA